MHERVSDWKNPTLFQSDGSLMPAGCHLFPSNDNKTLGLHVEFIIIIDKIEESAKRKTNAFLYSTFVCAY